MFQKSENRYDLVIVNLKILYTFEPDVVYRSVRIALSNPPKNWTVLV